MARPIQVVEQIERMESQLRSFAGELGSLRQQVEELLEENRRLSIENAHLTDRTKGYATEKGGSTGEAARILGQLYEDGYHICNVNYGGMRKGDCLFCLQSLQRSS